MSEHQSDSRVIFEYTANGQTVRIEFDEDVPIEEYGRIIERAVKTVNEIAGEPPEDDGGDFCA